MPAWSSAARSPPTGQLLAATSTDQTVRLWHPTAAGTAAVLTGHGDVVTSVAFSPDGSLLASTSDDTTARLWRIPDGRLAATLTGHTTWVNECAFSPDGGLLATVSSDRTIRLRDAATARGHCALR
jgi:WD40 repeat protein